MESNRGIFEAAAGFPSSISPNVGHRDIPAMTRLVSIGAPWRSIGLDHRSGSFDELLAEGGVFASVA